MPNTPASRLPISHDSETIYDNIGNTVRTATIIDGVETTFSHFEYNDRNELTVTTDALGNTQTRSYDGNGNTIEHIDEDSNVTRTYYDALNRIIAQEDALGHTAWIEYDENGNVIAQITPLDERTTFVYNENNELIETIDPLGNYNEE